MRNRYLPGSDYRVNTACGLLIEHMVGVVDVIVVLTLTHNTMQSVVAGSNNSGMKEVPR